MMKLIVFAVEQGLCAYVRTPGDYGILVDCGGGGSGDIGSPPQWLAENEATGLNGVYLAVTHPHPRHLIDFEKVNQQLSPQPLCCDTDQDWQAVEGSPGVRAYQAWLTAKSPADQPDFGASVRCFSIGREKAEEIGGDAHHVLNNQSRVFVISYTSEEGYSWKIVIAGDNEAECWEALLEDSEFGREIKEADFFVTPCHGQPVGLLPELFATMGKPLANISCRGGAADRPDARYRKYAQGVKFPDGSRTHFITPDDGNITVEMRDDGRFDVWLFQP